MKTNNKKWVFSEKDFLFYLKQELEKDNDFFKNRDYCLHFIASMRWGELNWECVHCSYKGEKIYWYTSRKTRKEYSTMKCGKCRRQFGVTVGTILHGNHIPPNKLLNFIYLKKILNYSAKKCSEMVGITWKSAWFLNHRLDYFFMNELPEKTKEGFYYPLVFEKL